MFIRIGTLSNIEVIDPKNITNNGLGKTASLASDWKQLVRKSFTQPKLEISGEFDTENFLYFKARTISAGEVWGPNGNGDYFPGNEIKSSIETFVSKGFYLEHDSDDPEKAKGILVSASYDDKQNFAECIVAVSKQDHPEICEKIKNGSLNAVSMGCICSEAECGLCGNIARNENELCHHMKPFMDTSHTMPNPNYIKGQPSDSPKLKAFGGKKTVYEINRKLVFNELSGVSKPADRDANIYQQTIIASKTEVKPMEVKDDVLSKMSYNDYKQIKKALRDEDEETLLKFASVIKAEIGQIMLKNQPTGEATTIKQVVKAAAPEGIIVEDLKPAEEAKKEEPVAEALPELDSKPAEEIPAMVEEVAEESEGSAEEEQELKTAIEVVLNKWTEKKKGTPKILKIIKKFTKELVKTYEKGEKLEDTEKAEDKKDEGVKGEVEAANLTAVTDHAGDTSNKTKTDVTLEQQGEEVAKKDSKQGEDIKSKSSQREANHMNLVYVPGKTFDKSFFIASSDKDEKVVVKASDLIPAEVQKLIEEGSDQVVSVEDAIVKMEEACGGTVEGFKEMASKTGSFAKKAYDFFAMKQEEKPASADMKEPVMAINEKEIDKGEKTSQSKAKVVQQYFNRLPGTTVADPDIALNLKSNKNVKADEVAPVAEAPVAPVAEVKTETAPVAAVVDPAIVAKDSIIAKQAEELKTLTAKFELLTKKATVENVSKIVATIEMEDEAAKAKLAESLSTLNEEQLAIVSAVLSTKKVEAKAVSASLNVPSYAATESSESNLETLVSIWNDQTVDKNVNSDY